MKRKEKREEELEALLATIAYPGDDEVDLERRIDTAGMADRIMNSLMEGPYRELYARSRSARKSYLWAAAALVNIALILLFEARPIFIDLYMGAAEIYGQLVFLAFGAAASVSIIGCVLSLNSSQIDKLIPAIFIRGS